MPLTREEYLEFCQICTKRSFNMNKGMICSLTQEHAAYDEDNCPDFELDELAQEKKAVQDKIRQAEILESQTFGMAKFGIKNQVAAGIVIIALAVIWLLVGLSFNWIFYYPFFLIIAGVVVLIQGLNEESKKARKKKINTSSDIIDDEII